MNNNNNKKLLHDRYSLIDSIDFDWKNGPQGPNTDWMEMYQRLIAYRKQYYTTNVSTKYNDGHTSIQSYALVPIEIDYLEILQLY